MPLSRNTRMDRRKQLILETTEKSADGVESAIQARRRTRRTNLDSATATPAAKRDAGYSQDVRSTCQQRLVQLIPVRRSSLTVVVAVSCLAWFALMAAHYFLHIRGSEATRQLPIAYLFHLRSYYSIPHWIATQLWMLTGIMAIMIFQIRKHKLDDYRARYRVWLGLAVAAIFASFDSSTTCLELLGRSIDEWARTEFGYSGMSVVLASFSAIIGVLGLRLCGELQSAPFAVALWLGGLIAWGISALLGTGLLRLEWSPSSVDMVVGGLWLGGILSVWLSAGIYLRHVYLHAHKRFLSRGGLVQPLQLKMPNLQWLKRNREESEGDQEVAEPKPGRLAGLKSMLRLRSKSSPEDRESTRTTKERKASRESRDAAPELTSNTNHRETQAESTVRDPKSTSPSSAGEAATSTKVERRSWFSRKPKASEEEPLAKEGAKPIITPKPKPAPIDLSKRRASDAEGKDEDSNQGKDGKPKRSWFGFGKSKPEASDQAAPRAKERSSQAPKVDKASVDKPAKSSEEKETKERRSWWPGRKTSADSSLTEEKKDKAKSERTSKPTTSESKSKEEKSNQAKSEGEGKKRGLFSFMEGFKLRPPVDENEAAVSKEAGSTSRPTQEKPASIPLPSTRPLDDEEDEEDRDSRGLSKAERKRMRRDQQNQRRAA